MGVYHGHGGQASPREGMEGTGHGRGTWPIVPKGDVTSSTACPARPLGPRCFAGLDSSGEHISSEASHSLGRH